MKTAKEVLEQYGKCCVSIARVEEAEYSDDEVGSKNRMIDHKTLKYLEGQKTSLEWLFE